jgi:hypothetical protein
MNKYNRLALSKFTEPKNVQYLADKLAQMFKGRPMVQNYVKGYLSKHVGFFFQQKDQDFLYSYQSADNDQPYSTKCDPEPGLTSRSDVADQVACLNAEFIQYMVDTINKDLLKDQDGPIARYNDGLNTSTVTDAGHMVRQILCDGNTSWIEEDLGQSFEDRASSNALYVQTNQCINDPRPKALCKYPMAPIGQDGRPCGASNAFKAPTQYSGLSSGYVCKSGMSKRKGLAQTADDLLKSWRFNSTRGSGVRDDPKGELTRERAANGSARTYDNVGSAQFNPLLPSSVNQITYPYGNTLPPKSCITGMDNLMADGIQSFYKGAPYGLSGRNGYQKGQIGANDQSGKCNKVIRDQMQRVENMKGHPSSNGGWLPSKVTMGAKKVDVDMGTASIEYGYTYQGQIGGEYENGVFENAFTGATGEIGADPVDRLLSTPYIQGLNRKDGEQNLKGLVDSSNILSSTFDHTAIGRRQAYLRGDKSYHSGQVVSGQYDPLADNPQNAVRFWDDGDSIDHDPLRYGPSYDAYGARSAYADKWMGMIGNSTNWTTTDMDVGRGPLDRPVANSVGLDANGDPIYFSDAQDVSDSGVWNDTDGAKLYGRRVFRNLNPLPDFGARHGDRASEQIPYWRKAVCNRYYDRDVDEVLNGGETGTLVRGYGQENMNLYCRLPNRKCGNNKYKV